jgi:hypothetical protein
MRRAALAGALALLALAAQPALASEPFSDTNVANATLAVDATGHALVSYTRADGRARHVLVWGAVNALPPSADVPQAHFRFDYSGGWASHRNGRYWRSFANRCRPYDGPPLAYLVTACKAPDGSYWALRSWQRKLPHRGFRPWRAGQTAFSLDVSHWSGEPGSLELYADWAFGGEAQGLFGRLTYRGVPVHGFGTTRTGAPTDRYGRGLYIDTLDSPYGPGWRRETSIVFRNPTGSFCYSFWPTTDVTLPGRPARPAGDGARYRISVMGPGVTPDLVAEAASPGRYDPGDPHDVAFEQQQLRRFDQVTAGDRFCPTQR